MNMKKLHLGLIASITMFGFVSCMEIDNFDEPAASIRGNIIDSTTGLPYVGCVGDNHIKIWEKSFSTNPAEQGLHIKSDGTYVNNKLFAGTYDMCPVDGPWFPVDTIRGVQIGNNNNATQDFVVTPYVKVKDFATELLKCPESAYDTLVVSGRLYAPYPKGYNGMDMPQVREIRPFVSNNETCGASMCMSYYYNDQWRVNVRKGWSAIGDMETGEGNLTYEFRLPVKRGYNYWVRMGVNMNDQYNHWNYSEIKSVTIPQ